MTMTETVAGTSSPLLELRKVSCRFGARPDLAARIAIALGAAKPFPIIHALDEVDLTIRKGEVLGLVRRVRLREVDARQNCRRNIAALCGTGFLEG